MRTVVGAFLVIALTALPASAARKVWPQKRLRYIRFTNMGTADLVSTTWVPSLKGTKRGISAA
jgi:ABC-type Mn2+/Zn2+ transport system permease subunit